MVEQNKRQLQYNAARQALLSAGLEVFVRKGYAGTKIRDITDNAQMSPGLLFHYFSSKEAILEELMKEIGSEFDKIASLLRSNDDPEKIFTEVASIILNSFSEKRSRYMFLLVNQTLTMDSIPPTIKAISERSQSVELSTPLIEAGQQVGVFRSGDPFALSITFWGALQGIAEMLAWKPEATIPTAEMAMSILLVKSH